jgi:hypothetical protein
MGLAAFWLLGVGPALLAGGWCVSRNLPGRVQAEADVLGRQLGLKVTLGGLTYLRPGVTLYERVEASDPETGKPLFRCRLLETNWQPRNDAAGQRQTVVALTVSQGEVETGALPQIWQCLQRSMKRPPGSIDADVRLSAADLTLCGPRNPQTLTDVEGLLETLPSGTHAQLHFRLVGADTPEPVCIRLFRNRQTSPPEEGFELCTGGGQLPCSVLAMGLSELGPLGPRARFRGRIWANETPDGWEAEIAGQLVELDLGSLVGDHFPHRLSGVGQATIQRARLRRGRLEEANATLVAGPGTVDRLLLAAAVNCLELSAPPDVLSLLSRQGASGGDRIAYEQLAMAAALDAQGLRLQGRCAAVEPGTILCDARGRLLGEPPANPQPVAELVRMLVPQSAVQVPASRQTDWLLQHLPVPDLAPLPGGEPPTAHLRPAETWRR